MDIVSEAVDADREAHGKKPFNDDNDPPASHGKRSDNTSFLVAYRKYLENCANRKE